MYWSNCISQLDVDVGASVAVVWVNWFGSIRLGDWSCMWMIVIYSVLIAIESDDGNFGMRYQAYSSSVVWCKFQKDINKPSLSKVRAYLRMLHQLQLYHGVAPQNLEFLEHPFRCFTNSTSFSGTELVDLFLCG